MTNYKDWNIKSLGNYIVLGIVVLLVVMLFMMVVVPILGHVHVIFQGITLTDTLLFFILLRLLVK